jgi:hypothetical protein
MEGDIANALEVAKWRINVNDLMKVGLFEVYVCTCVGMYVRMYEWNTEKITIVHTILAGKHHCRCPYPPGSIRL